MVLGDENFVMGESVVDDKTDYSQQWPHTNTILDEYEIKSTDSVAAADELFDLMAGGVQDIVNAKTFTIEGNPRDREMIIYRMNEGDALFGENKFILFKQKMNEDFKFLYQNPETKVWEVA